MEVEIKLAKLLKFAWITGIEAVDISMVGSVTNQKKRCGAPSCIGAEFQLALVFRSHGG